MNLRLFFRVTGILYALFSIVLGAFGAHALKLSLEAQDTVSIWETAVQYQMWHALALLILSVFPEDQAVAKVPGFCWILGTLLFSGSLFLLAVGGPKWLGPVTPVGGILLISGWVALLLVSRKK